MKNFAIFTITKDEKFFLPIWLNHYKKFFDSNDIFVLNHQSIDGSCDSTGVNVVDIHNDVAFSHFWLVEQVQNFQKKLLESYEVVVFCEVDEIIYSLKSFNLELKQFLHSKKDLCNVFSHEIVHDIKKEKPLSIGIPITKQRSYWFHWPIYDKPLITKVPLKYAPGFHSCHLPNNFDFEFQMLHLHRVDFNQMLERHRMRVSKWKLANEGGLGFQHKIGDDNGVLKLLNDHPSLEVIPTDHKLALEHIVPLY